MEQIDKLANFIMGNVPGEPSKSEGAGDCAIRLLQDRQALIDALKDLRECLSIWQGQPDVWERVENWLFNQERAWAEGYGVVSLLRC